MKESEMDFDMEFDDEDIERRAWSAYFRYGGSSVKQPARDSSNIEEHANKAYYVLRNGVSNVLAVYRIKPDGFLKRLRRWPKEIEEIQWKGEG